MTTASIALGPNLAKRALVPASFIPFDYVNSVPMPALNATTAIINFIVPAGRNGVVSKIANTVQAAGFTEFNAQVKFQITADGNPIQGYNNIQGSLGLINNPVELPVGFRIVESQVIQVTIENLSLGPGGTVAARLIGFFYPKAYEQLNVNY
jgi:hypothetical protein